MMTVEKAKEKFKAEYTRPWFDLIDEHPNELFFRTAGGNAIKVSSDDLNSYVDFENRRGTLETKPFESCLCSPTHYEQLITAEPRFASQIFSLRNGERIVFGKSGADQLTVEIGEATSDFKNYMRFHPYSVMRTLDRLRLNRTSRRSDRELADFVYTPTTVRVIGLQEATVEHAAEKAIGLIEGCLFNLAYLKGIALVLEEELPRRHAIAGSFRYEESDFGSELPLPKSKINPDVARFYQRAMAVEDPVNQFLSFYQVLEYFFLSVSDEELYRKISSVLHDPSFSTKPKNLDRIIQATLNHKRESDETEMLRLVLVKHIDEMDLVSFIKTYEEHLTENWFTKKRKLFGKDNEIKTAAGHVIGNVANRVKLIRNALVHSSDRHDRQERFIPTRAAEAEIRKEVPLVKYLAEKVIIGSST